MPEAHAKVSPSGLDGFSLCAGKLAAEQAIKSQPGYVEPTSKAAEDGSRRHALFEWRQRNPTAAWPTEVEGYKIVSQDIEMVQGIIEYFVNHPALKDADCGVRWLEEKVEIGRWIGLPEHLLWGTADVIFADRTALEIADAKFGRMIVSPENNWQLKAYALGAGAKLDWGGKHRGVKTVRLTIAQPTNEEEPINTVEYDINLMMDVWKPQLKAIVDAALDPAALRTPGDKQCHFCLAKGSCRERMESAAVSMFDTLPTEETLPPVATVDAIADIVDVKLTQDPKELSNEELGKLADQAGLLEGFIRDARKELERRLKAGEGSGSGWKLVAGRKKRVWTVDDALVEKTLRGCGLKVSDIYPREIPSVPKAEALVKIKGRKAMDRLAKVFDVQDGAPTLAPEGDSRPGVIETMFEKLDEAPAESTPQPLPAPDWL